MSTLGREGVSVGISLRIPTPREPEYLLDLVLPLLQDEKCRKVVNGRRDVSAVAK